MKVAIILILLLMLFTGMLLCAHPFFQPTELQEAIAAASEPARFYWVGLGFILFAMCGLYGGLLSPAAEKY